MQPKQLDHMVMSGQRVQSRKWIVGANAVRAWKRNYVGKRRTRLNDVIEGRHLEG
jgi:hypothetical protein